MNDSLAAIERVLTRGLSTPTAGSLQLIGTPLGNLGDLSLRAIDTLGNLDCLYCEDTRTTASLLRVLGFRVELRSLTDHNEATRRPEILASLSEGARIGLVSRRDFFW